ncbi:hypothetical protein QTN47_21590 [Danxiaibacter flavus]|uniref:Zinc ribbon domain-containing protein n=1 Tax=Danxiaibacter flavus TaxID=3049108 RepID=A0ABV3ZJR3_9BACT|nr:hypothetical protein QNM32_21595 [Chitinophagaceae bacterium DXS]
MTKITNISQLTRLHTLIPARIQKPAAVSCGRCNYVNEVNNVFCTNCGYPIKHTPEVLSLYHIRDKSRHTLLTQCNSVIVVARWVLYVLAALCLTGTGFMFGSREDKLTLFIITFIMAVMFGVLGYWSRYKPFTALLVSFVVVITFSTISVFGSVIHAFTTTNGLYTILFSMVIIYFLLRGIQAAYRADLVNEELEIV